MADVSADKAARRRRSESTTNLNILDLGSILQSLSATRRSGTLKVTHNDDESRLLYIRKGLLRLTSSTMTGFNLLEEAMVKFRKMNREDIEEARKNYGGPDQSVVEFFKQQERISDQDVKGYLVSLMFELATEVLCWKDVHCEFFPDRLLEPDLLQELADYGQATPVDGLLLEAARRADEWERIHKTFDASREVFELVREMPEHLTQPAERELAAWVDGFRDVSELVDISGLSSFQACELLLEMVNNGYVQALGAEELIQLGGTAAAKGDWPKALNLYQRAHTLDRKHPDLPMRLAAAHETLGNVESARKHLLTFAKECITGSRFDEASRACRHLIRIEPEDPEHRAKLFKCLLATEERTDLASVGRELVLIYEERGVLDRAVEIIAKLRSIYPDEAELAEIDARIRLATAERTEALIEYEKLADAYLAKGELENAVRTFRKIVDEIDEECLEARLQMAETLIQLERIDEAVAEYTKLADILMRTGVFDGSVNLPFVLKVHRRVAELDSSNTSSREWLADSFAKQGDKEQAIAEFDELLAIYQADGNREKLVYTLQRIADLFPDVLNYREWLAECYLEDKGGREKAKPELQALLRAAWQQEDFETGVRVAERILELEPFYMEAHVLLGESLLGKGEKDAALEKMLSVAFMYMGAGLVKESEEVLRETLDHDGGNADAHRFLAAVLEERNAKEEAATHYKKAGLLSLAADNFGSARTYLELANELGGPDVEVDEALERIAADHARK